MVIKTGRFGEFLACTTLSRRARAPAPSRSGIKCPKCLEGDLAERRTKRGKSFWGCVRYPACDFSTWNRPVPETCAECGWVGMEKKVSKAEGETRTCLKCGNKIVARRARGGGAGVNATVVGGGLAGSEAAWALAERGVARDAATRCGRSSGRRPTRPTGSPSSSAATPSNRSSVTNAHGLLKAELRALGSLLLPCADLARVPGGTALAVDREVFSQAVHERVTAHPQHHASCARRRPSCPSPGVVATGPLTSARLTAAIVAPAGLGGARVLRRHRADRLVRLARPRAALRALALRQGRGRRLPQRADGRATRTSAFLDALLDGRPVPGPRVRPGAVLRGLPAGRGDGAPRPRDAALRADEAGRAARSAHRPRAARRGAAPPGGPRGADVEPGRLPDPAPHPGAAAGVPHDSRARAGRVPALRQHPPELATSTARRAWARRSPRGTTTGCSSPASSPASRATPSRSAPGSSPASTWRAGSTGRPAAVPPPTTMLGALYRYLREADPKHFQPMNANFGLLEPLPGKVKKDRKKELLVERAQAEFGRLRRSSGDDRSGGRSARPSWPRGSEPRSVPDPRSRSS